MYNKSSIFLKQIETNKTNILKWIILIFTYEIVSFSLRRIFL